MESFSWSDSLRALAAPCLSCLRTSKTERNDLEDLLVDSGSGTTDAETLSLHSNPGSPRRKRARFTRHIRLFGWDLFGRPPIRLPDDDEDDDEEEGSRTRREQGESRRSRRRQPPPALSTSTLDSDAAPLDSAAIETHATRRAEEETSRAERRARRRERKERKRAAALALALEHAAVLDGNTEFEGFPGSGGHLSQFTRGSDEYRDNDDEDEDEHDEGDFGAGGYTRRSRGGSDSGRGSDSRSRTSTSLSSGPQPAQPYNHHYISQQPSAVPAPAQTVPALPAQRSKKGKSSRSSASKTTSSSSRRSHSSPSASQSPSLASPVATQFSDPAPVPPRAAQQFEGFPNDLGLHTAGIERLSSGFPSPGFGGPRNGKRDMGAFLANRGDA